MKSIKDFICFFLAFLVAFFVLENSFTVPDCNMAEQCETALREFLDNPQEYLTTNNLKITIKGTTITASTHYSFVYSTATLDADGTYEIETSIRIIAYTFVQILLLVLLACSICAILDGFLHVSSFVYKKSSIYLKKFFKYINKKLGNLRDYFKQKRMQKQLKEYEDPRFKEIYQLGYNVGYADGISEGTTQAKNSLPDT